jgi:hypothetical protein
MYTVQCTITVHCVQQREQHEHWVKLLHGTVVQGRVKVVSKIRVHWFTQEKRDTAKRGLDLGCLARPPSWSAHRIFGGEGGFGCITVAVSKQDFLARELKLSFLANLRHTERYSVKYMNLSACLKKNCSRNFDVCGKGIQCPP